jgi:hypothetical protein
VVILVLILVLLVGLGIASLFVRRHGEVDRPGPDWRPTDELFSDPSTKRLMRVWVDGRGERHYVREGRGPHV